jgi:hypothetical protein
MRCLATNTQKATTGAMMRNIVRNTDLTSGPNMNLPCKKNSCKWQRQNVKSHQQSPKYPLARNHSKYEILVST